MFTPTHLLIAPLNRTTLSLVASAIVELIRSKGSFDLLQLSVLSEHATQPAPTHVVQPTATSNDPHADAFDVVAATMAELRALGIPVVDSLASLNVDPNACPFAWTESNSARAPVEWVLDVAAQDALAERQALYAPLHAQGIIRKVAYLRPVETDLSGQQLAEHEIIIHYGLLAEDLPYLPIDIPAVSCPVKAATSALYPERSASLSRRASTRSMLSRSASLRSLGGAGSSSSPVLAAPGLGTSTPPLIPAFDEFGRPFVPYPECYPIPMSSLMSFIVSILSSKFIYEQLYTVTGAKLQLPGVSPLPLNEVVAAHHVHVPPTPHSAPLSASPEAMNGGLRLTPPPSPEMHDATMTAAAALAPGLEPEAILNSPHMEPHMSMPPCLDDDQISLEEHLQHLHDHAHQAHAVHLASLTTPSARTLQGIARAFHRGQFAVHSGDFARILHQTPPAYHLVAVVPSPTGGGGPGGGGGELEDSGVVVMDKLDHWDENVLGPLANADHYHMAGGRYTIAVRATAVPTDAA